MTYCLYTNNTQSKFKIAFHQATKTSSSFSTWYITFLRRCNSSGLRVHCCHLAHWSNCRPVWSTWSNI